MICDVAGTRGHGKARPAARGTTHSRDLRVACELLIRGGMKQLALMLTVVGCGSSSSPGKADAPVMPDTPSGPDAAAIGMVSVHVVDEGAAVANATIVFSLPSGEVGSTAMTNASGDATGTITAGGSVTAAFTSNTTHLLMTAFDVQVGDQLVLGVPSGPPGAGAAQGSVAVAYPSTVTNATSYASDVGCAQMSGSTTGTVTIPLTASCQATAGTFDVISFATDTNGALLAYSVAAALTVPGSGNTLNQTMPAWRTDAATATLTVSNAPPDQMVVAKADIHDDPVQYSQFPQVRVTVTAGGQASVAPSWPKSVGNAVSWIVQVPYPSGIEGQAVKAFEERTTALNSTTRGYDATALPTLTSRSVSVASGHDTPNATWTTASAPVAGTSGQLVQVGWNVPSLGTFEWLAAVPADATSVQYPRLPDSLATSRVAVDQPFQAEAVYIVQSDLFADPAAFRQTWGNFVVPPATNYKTTLSVIQ